jgi:hypothetical protein
MMKISSRSEACRIPVDLMGHTGFATDGGAIIPWPVMRHFLKTIQEVGDHLCTLNEEMKKWHNRIPDGEKRVESISRAHEDAAYPLERIAFVNEAVARAEARGRCEIVPVKRCR